MTTSVGGPMRALRYHADPLRYLAAGALGKRAPLALAPLRLERVPLAEAPPGWHHVRVRLAGVCGSDLGLLFGKNSPRLSGFFSFPAVLGHEVVGDVEGTRVVLNPQVSCRERGLAPCDACDRGDDHLCVNIADGTVAPGLIGYNRDLPGGWGEAVVAAESRLHVVPDAVPDERAVLAEPFAVALRGARIALGNGVPRHVLVIGAGSIGLLAVAALRHAGYSGSVHVVARYPLQADAARSLGADTVHGDAASASDAVGGRAIASVIGPPGRRGGFDVVIDAAGSPSSLDAATWAAREAGRVVLLGAPGAHRHDFSPHWFREVALLGSYVYTAAEFGEATEALEGLDGLERIVTHRYPLERYREALRDVRRRRALKAVFAPNG